MMLQKRVLLFSIVLNLLTVGVDCSCDIYQTVERDDTKIIHCTVSGSIQEQYWYQGSTFDTQPILRLKNGNKGGTKYNDGHYDITDEGYMKIIDAQIQQEAVYTLAVIFTNGSTWSQSISVRITVTPEPPCPTVQFCTGCDECQRKVLSNTLITLSCSIDEVRPKIPLYWLDEDDNTQLNVSHSEEINPLTDTWTLSSSITIKMESCGEKKVIYCSVQNDAEMPSIFNRTVIIHSEKCLHWLPTKPSSQTPEKLPVISILIICGFFLLFVGISLIIFKIWKRHLIKAKVNSLETVLKKLYLDDQMLGNLEHLYNNGRTYKVTFSSSLHDETEHNDISLLHALQTSSCNDRVLFFGKAGIGKTCLIRHILRMWSKGRILKDHILIYYQLWRITEKTCLLEELKQTLPSTSNLSIDDIQQTLQNRNTIIILDGTGNLSLSETSTEIEQNNFNVWNLLKGENETFQTMKVWVTGRKIHVDNSGMHTPSMKIYLNDFDREDIAINLERFITTLKLNTSPEFSLKQDKISIADQEKEETSENTPLVDKYGSLEHILSDVNKHLDTIASSDKTKFTDSLMSRLLFLICLCSKREEEIDKKVEALCNFSSEKFKETIDYFIKDNNWEIVAWLLEAGTNNEEEFADFPKTLHWRDLVFSYMAVDNYQQSVLHLLNALNVSETELLSLDMCVNNPFYVVNYLPLVKDRLVVRYTHLSVDDFEPFIKAAVKRSKTIEFYESNIPDDLEKLLDISEYEDVKVLHKKDNTTFYLNFKEGKWESQQNDENEC